MISANGIIGAALGIILLAIWRQIGRKLASALDAIVVWFEKKTGRDVPDGLVQVAKDIIMAAVSASNNVLNRSFWGAVGNRIRQGKGEEALQMFIDAMKRVDWSKAIGPQLPVQIKEWWDWAREEVATEVAVSAATVHEQISGANPLPPDPRPAIKAAVIVDKHAPADAQPTPEKTKEVVLRHLDELAAECRARQQALQNPDRS